MNIAAIAREAGMVVYEGDQDRVLFDGRILEALQRFHDLAIAQYREGLLAGSGEPVAWHEPGAFGNVTTHKKWATENGWLPLYTHPAPVNAQEVRLWDSQWVNVVNHDNAYRDWSKEDAINHAVKMTEKLIAENVNGNKLPPAPVNQQLLEKLKGAAHYIDKLGGVSQPYRQAIAQAEGK